MPPSLLTAARYCASPNQNRRPDPEDVSLLVLHAISLPPGEFGSSAIEQLFTNTLTPSDHPYFPPLAELRVSSHLLIRRDGELVQFVPFDRRAWHAGHSCYRGRRHCNDFSIGIELEGDERHLFTEPQYQQLFDTTRWLLDHFPRLSPHHIVGHADIAPARKTDPGPMFHWWRLRQALTP
ncbi:1,6-anhydro-N-acetylmuramyl-L-alanine amidase AmpD [Ectothiorhodospiraceae bacterium BW-2]|nr:1,6-anhydro-N-acetylmuramyl-L-alanine amidase AmpD [Ectothiorhodospiraceae bacterium BW-2]